MKIILAQIPEEGLTIHLKPGQNRDLDQWVSHWMERSQPIPEFELLLELKPMNSPLYELRGHFRMKVQESCSRCGQDFNFWHQVKINEILTPFQDQPDQEGANRLPENLQVETWVYRDGVFNVIDFLQNVWVLSWPMAWAPAVNDEGHCEGCGNWVGFEGLKWESSSGTEPLNTPFAKLRKN